MNAKIYFTVDPQQLGDMAELAREVDRQILRAGVGDEECTFTGKFALAPIPVPVSRAIYDEIYRVRGTPGTCEVYANGVVNVFFRIQGVRDNRPVGIVKYIPSRGVDNVLPE